MNSTQSWYLELLSNASDKNKKQKKTCSVIYERAVEEEISSDPARQTTKVQGLAFTVYKQSENN